ncbi:MAG: anti-sigma factor, partial [Chloroflexi bacterium]|nr:anti-sigma factor [Chloroflexota bacterium]
GPARRESSAEPILPLARTAATRGARPGARVMPWLAGVAAAVVLSVAATAALVGQRLDSQAEEQSRAIAGLEIVTSATMGITASPDAQRVSLNDERGMPAGTLLFSPGSSQLVVVATGLVRPPSGQEYRCWLDVDGHRQNVGRMNFARDLAFWVGTTPSVAGVPAGTTFGVSLTDVGGTSLDAEPVIVGRL